jgi:hypothetical protein
MKKCVRGGDPQRRRYWEEVGRQWQKSGQTVRAFCRAEGLRESTFYFWRRELARRQEQHKERKRLIAKKGESVSAGLKATAMKISVKQQPPQKPKPSFLPVHVIASHGNETACANEAARGGIEIVLAQGRMVRVAVGFDRQTLVDVLSILEPRPC